MNHKHIGEPTERSVYCIYIILLRTDQILSDGFLCHHASTELFGVVFCVVLRCAVLELCLLSCSGSSVGRRALRLVSRVSWVRVPHRAAHFFIEKVIVL